ncbi:MAG: glycosyltransferase [Prevotellaceae bacterium]|jgi:glycosyltransferase involved in cell wall biosynthesis|nr:glycosyltransferase [Prevotellaceae bacterium]
MKNTFFLSICIPSYNRPHTLTRLLQSIDSKYFNDIQIVICEDKSPMREEVRDAVNTYRNSSSYAIKYVENVKNLGFDANWRELSLQADGEYLLYMGDDDRFIPNALDNYIQWLKEHSSYCYILRSYVRRTESSIEYFRYYSHDAFFEPGVEAYEEFFLKSVSMSGYTVKRECALQFLTSDLDDTLLFQLYLLAEICLKYPSAYCNTPCVELVSDQVQLFGNSDVEKEKYIPGTSVAANMNFLLSYFKITQYIDKKYGIQTTEKIKKEFSKYSFYSLRVQRKYGRKHLKSYANVMKSHGLDSSWYFYLYFWSLYIFGSEACLWVIRVIKKMVGRRLIL